MAQRLTPAEAALLDREGRATPMHIGELAIFQAPPGGLDYDAVVALLERRLAGVPRYRQKLRAVPGHLAAPVWVDDPAFDIGYHVRRSALPRPGSDRQLLEFCARIHSRPLDRSRPLWELYFVEGLAGDRVAIVTKTHQVLVDGTGSVDIGQVIVDPPHDQPAGDAGPWHPWHPDPEPGSARLLLDAVTDLASRPWTAVGLGIREARLLADRLAGVSGVAAFAGMTGRMLAAARDAVRPAPIAPLSATVGEARRLAIARTALADHQRVHTAHGASVTAVVLATVAGALRGFLLHRGESVTAGTSVRALVPVSVRDARQSIHAAVVPLPVGEPDPLRRLRLVHDAMTAHQTSGRPVGAGALAALSGFAPPTLHALAARAAQGLRIGATDLVVTNVPGPQEPRHTGGARMLEAFPFLPLAPGHALAIGATSYDGSVCYAVTADRDAVPDAPVVAALLVDALAELVVGERRAPRHAVEVGR